MATSPAYDVIKNHYSTLHCIMADPHLTSKLIAQLFDAGMLSYDERCRLEDCAGRGAAHQATELMALVMKLVAQDMHNFKVFLDVLKKDAVFFSTAALLKETYKNLHVIQSQDVSILESEDDGTDDDRHSLNMLDFQTCKDKTIVVVSNCDNEWGQQRGCKKLFLAARNGRLQELKHILEELHLDPLIRNGKGESVLHIAALKGQMKILRYMVLEKKCSPLVLDLQGRSPFHYACNRSNLETVKYMVEELGADPFSGDEDSTTGLHFAAMGGQLKVVRYLLEEKGATMSRNGHGCSPLTAACVGGHLDVVQYLLDKHPIERDNNDNSILHWAVLSGSLDTVQYLVEMKLCDPLCQNQYGVTPLHYACERGYMKIVSYLVEKAKCDPSCKDNYGNTPLHFAAAFGGNLEVITYLVECTPECCNKGNKYGLTPLDVATTFNQRDNLHCLAVLSNQKLPIIKHGLPPKSKFRTENNGKTIYIDCNGNCVKWNHPQVLESLGPLPCGWQIYQKVDGEVVFINIEEQVTSYEDPRVSYKAYQQALQECYINLYMIKVVLTGAAGVGKTQLLKLLFNESLSHVRRSTSLLAKPLHDLRKLPTLSIRYTKPSFNMIDSLIADGIQYLKCKVNHGGFNVSLHTSISAAPDKKIQKFRKHKKKVHPDVQQELLTLSGVSSLPFEVEWLHIFDSGGLPQFHHMLPTFVQHVDCNLVVFNAHDQLNEHHVVEFYDDKGKCTVPSCKTNSTNEEIIVHCAHMFSQTKSSKIMFVGTHWDFDLMQQDVQLKDQRLLHVVRPTLKEQLIYSNPGKDKLAFFLNTANPVLDDEVAAEIYTNILSLKDQMKPLSVSLQWLLFHQEIKTKAENNETDVMDLQRCLEIGESLSMTNGAVIKALEFFSDYSIFIFYHSLLPDVLLTNPQSLFDAITQLLLEPSLQSSCQISPTIANGFLPEQRIEEIFARFPKLHNPPLFHAKRFIALLVGLKILSKFKRSPTAEYFMPAALNELTMEEVKIISDNALSNVDPLLVYFQGLYVLQGTFCRLVASLLSSDLWEVAWESGSPTCAFTNCVKLVFKSDIIVTLCDYVSFFQVTVSKDHEAACSRIKKAIFNELEQLHFGKCKPEFAFYCPCQSVVECSETRRHMAQLIDDHLICSLDAKKTYPLRATAIEWLQDPTPNFISVQINDNIEDDYLLIQTSAT